MSRIFAADAETDGLLGSVWAVGAVLLDGGAPVATFAGQLNPWAVMDPWTRENVVPVVDLPRYASRPELLETFWAFWERHGPSSEAVANVGFPVEAGLYRACMERDPAVRWNRGPYPLHELATAFWALGVGPDVDTREFCGRLDLVPHDPLDDATAAALCWARLAEMRAGNG